MGRRVLIDTSVFVASERGIAVPLEEVGQAAVSVVTIAQLEVGVLAAVDGDVRAKRLATLTRALSLAAPLPVDSAVAAAFSRLAAARIAARERVDANDTWIAATAIVHGSEVWTRDRDFERFEGLSVRVFDSI